MAADDWRDRKDIDHTTGGESLNLPIVKLTDEQLHAIAARGLTGADKKGSSTD